MIARSPVKPATGKPAIVGAKRAPTPLRSTPVSKGTTSILTSATATGSTATPHEAMVASQQGHINDLVQKNRSLEQTIKKLNEDLSKSAADILALTAERKSWEADHKTWSSDRQKWADERTAWIEGCDTMQACHRIQQYRAACALYDERVAVLKMQEVARKEQLGRLRRDFKITMFQQRETELEARLEEMEELRDEAMEVRDRYEKFAQELKARSVALADQVKSKTAEAQSAHGQCEQAEEDLRRLREAHADATATSTATSSKLARLTAERDALNTQVASLKHSLELAQDEATQLRAQLTNWQSLKKGEDADAEEVRKKKSEVEEQLQEARKRISELDVRTSEIDGLEAKLEKQKGRTEKLKETLEAWKTGFQEQTTAREAAESEAADARTQIATLEKKVIKLESQLSAAFKPKPSSKKAPLPQLAESNEELENTIAAPSTSALPNKVKEKSSKPISKSKRPSESTDAPAKSRPAKQPGPIPEIDSDIEILDSPPVSIAAPERSTKAKGKQKAIQEEAHGSSVEVVEVRKEKKGKQKEKGKDTEAKGPTKAKATKSKKTTPSDDTDETQPKTKEKPNSRKRVSPDPPKKSKSKSSQPKDDSEAEADVAPKKKKRKINLFGGSQPSTFDWNSLTQPEEGLGIPTRLSPVKDTDVVPRRLGRASKG